MTETTEKPICGFGFADGPLCRELRQDRWCEKHDQPAFSVCKGCGGFAIRECPHQEGGDEFCRTTVCENCVHQLDDSHGPAVGSAFTPPPPEPSKPAPQLVEIRKALIEVVTHTLTSAQQQGKISFTGTVLVRDLAETVFDELSTHVALTTLMAMASTTEQVPR